MQSLKDSYTMASYKKKIVDNYFNLTTAIFVPFVLHLA